MKRFRSLALVLLATAMAFSINVSDNPNLAVQVNAATISVNKLNKPENVRICRYDNSSFVVRWDSVEGAASYKIFRSLEKEAGYVCVGETKKTSFHDYSLKKGVKYYYKVQAISKSGSGYVNSALSLRDGLILEDYKKKTVFAGDSIMTGMSKEVYNAASYLEITGDVEVYAYTGINTSGFMSKEVFDGKTGVEAMVQGNPYRIYIMLGMNEISYANIDTMAKNFQSIVDYVKEKSPKTDIVILSVSPVSAANKSKFSNIGSFNKKLKELAKENSIGYYDFSKKFKDSNGNLKYCGGDGIHWTVEGYKQFAKLVSKFDTKRDK